MDIIKKLRNYFFGLLLISIGLTAWVIIMEANNLKIMYVDDSLINTIIASFYAVTIAVWIYWRQQHDRYEILKSSLKQYLDYIAENLPSKNFPTFQDQIIQIDKEKKPNVFMIEVTKEEIEILEDDFINALINSGYFYNILNNLLELQKGIKTYKEYKNILTLDRFDRANVLKGRNKEGNDIENEYNKIVEYLNKGIKRYTSNITAIRKAI